MLLLLNMLYSIACIRTECCLLSQDLHALEQENLQMDYDKRSNNDLLDYLRLLEPDMVINLFVLCNYKY